MSAQRTRMDIISQNIANVNTTRDENGNPYRKDIIKDLTESLTLFITDTIE
jgi:flagellar basal-body rod protein FlgC